MNWNIIGIIMLLMSVAIMAIPQLSFLGIIGFFLIFIGTIILVFQALKEDGFFENEEKDNTGLYCVLFMVGLTLFSVFNTGYKSPYEDDESSAYMSMLNKQEDPELYKNDYYMQSLNKLPINGGINVVYGAKKDNYIPKGDWGEVILFGLESNKNDLFVIPSFSGKYDYSTFRALAKRAVFLEWKGTGQSVYDYSIVLEIRKRFIDYCKVDFTTSKDRKDFVETCKFNYIYNMEEEDFKLLNSKYGADYLIENKIETPRTLNLPIAWENDEFIIYWLGGKNETQS